MRNQKLVNNVDLKQFLHQNPAYAAQILILKIEKDSKNFEKYRFFTGYNYRYQLFYDKVVFSDAFWTFYMKTTFFVELVLVPKKRDQKSGRFSDLPSPTS